MTAVIVSRKKIPLCSILFIFISVICSPNINALQYKPQNHRIIADINDNNDIFCTDDVYECPDGTFVSRDPTNGCNFEPCQEDKVIDTEEEVVVEKDIPVDIYPLSVVDKNEETSATVDTKVGDTDNIEQTDPTTIVATEEEQSPQILPEETNIENDEDFVTEEAIGTLEDDEEEEEIPPPNVYLPPEQESGIETSDSTIMEETDVKEAADELLEEAEAEEEKLEEEEEKSTTTATTPQQQEEDSPELSSSNTIPTTTSHRSAWVAHGTVGTIVFGLLLPSSISSALFRNYVPTYWIYIHVLLNSLVFALTFFTVGIAITNMNEMLSVSAVMKGEGTGGHFKELHHIVGLLLLMLISFQTANGFLRPPREFITDDEDDQTPGAILRSTMNDKGISARTLWTLVHRVSGLAIFALGIYQVKSGLHLFSQIYGTMDWSTVYIGYICWLVGLIVSVKLWIVWKNYKIKKRENMALEMGRGSNVYDPEGDLTVARWETV